MRAVLALIAGSAALAGGGPAFAQEFWAGGGVSQRGTDFEAKGVLLGVLKPETAFVVSRSDISGAFSIAGGYDHQFGGGFFGGVEASLDLSDVAVAMDKVSSTGSLQHFSDIIMCPPPGFPGPCLIFPGPLLYTSVETQALGINVSEKIGGSLQLKAGYTLGKTSVWASAGLAARQVEMAYDLPALLRVSVPAGFETTTTRLPAESRSEDKTLNGSVWGAGISHDLTDNLSLALVYRRSDYGEVGFANTARVRGLEVGGQSESGDISLRWRF